MINEFEAKITSKQKEELDDYRKKYPPLPHAQTLPPIQRDISPPFIQKQLKNENGDFWKMIIVGMLILGFAFFGYLIYEDHFKSEINQNQEVTFQPNISITDADVQTFNNDYYMNHTIIINNIIEGNCS